MRLTDYTSSANPASDQLSPSLEAGDQPPFYLAIGGKGEPPLVKDNTIRVSTFFILVFSMLFKIQEQQQIKKKNQTMETNADDPDTKIITQEL